MDWMDLLVAQRDHRIDLGRTSCGENNKQKLLRPSEQPTRPQRLGIARTNPIEQVRHIYSVLQAFIGWRRALRQAGRYFDTPARLWLLERFHTRLLRNTAGTASMQQPVLPSSRRGEKQSAVP